MITFFVCLLFCFILTGWALLFSKILATEIQFGYFNAIAFCCLVSFLGFLLRVPNWTAEMLLGGGGLFLIGFTSFYYKKNKSLLLQYQWVVLCFLSFSLLFFLLAYGIKFRSIDDYSFWGLASKYLYSFNSLPQNSDYINANFLTYIPALASFHYLLYSLGQHYSIIFGYFAQDIVLVSAMLTVLNHHKKTRSLLLLAVWYLLLSLAYGMPSLRMEVDSYVASYFFAVSWIIYLKRDRAFTLIIIPILFLSVIKEIGFLFALCSLILFTVVNGIKGKNKYYLLFTVLGVIAIKCVWKIHVTHLGFESFAQAISLDNALSALNPFNTYYQPAQWLYLKTSLFAGFDRTFNTPYCLVYLLMSVVAYSLVRQYPEKKRVVLAITGSFALFAFTYWVMIYLLQAVVFHVGHGIPKILDYQRYYNMLFLPWLAIMVFIYLDIKNPPGFDSFTKVPSFTLLMLVFVFLVVGKIERSHRFYNPYKLDQLLTLIEQKSEATKKSNWTLCLLTPPTPTYQLVMPMTYYFMPHRVSIPVTEQQKNRCDFSFRWVAGTLVEPA